MPAVEQQHPGLGQSWGRAEPPGRSVPWCALGAHPAPLPHEHGLGSQLRNGECSVANPSPGCGSVVWTQNVSKIPVCDSMQHLTVPIPNIPHTLSACHEPQETGGERSLLLDNNYKQEPKQTQQLCVEGR